MKTNRLLPNQNFSFITMKKTFSILAMALMVLLPISAQNVSRTEVSLDSIKGSMVLFTFGQSNSANYGQISHLYKARNAVYNYSNGHLYRAQDPLVGASGNGASVWGRVGDLLIDEHIARKVTIIPIGIGSVKVGDWAKSGKLYTLLEQTLDDLVKRGIKIDYICWHQGESDNIANTPTETYIKSFLSIREAFRSRGLQAPFIVAVVSYHPECLAEGHGISQDIRNAQIKLAKDYDDIFPGPDTDKLNQLYMRADGVHFSYLGQQLHAKLWVKAIKKLQ
jgi:lysophospholipase L1-like esterase